VHTPPWPGVSTLERELFANTAHVGLRRSYLRRQTRRAVVTLFGLVSLLAAGVEFATACDRLPGQAPRIPRIGWVANTYPDGQGDPAIIAVTQAPIAGLGDYGYIPGQNLQMESRFPTEANRNARMVDDLLGLGVDVLVTGGTIATLPAKQATSTVPIVASLSVIRSGQDWCRASPDRAAT